MYLHVKTSAPRLTLKSYLQPCSIILENFSYYSPNILPIILISNPHLLVHNTVMYTKQRCEMTLQDLKVDVKNITFCIQQSQYSLKGMTEYISVAAKKAAQKLTMLIIPKWLHGLLFLSIILLCSAFRARINYPWMC